MSLNALALIGMVGVSLGVRGRGASTKTAKATTVRSTPTLVQASALTQEGAPGNVTLTKNVPSSQAVVPTKVPPGPTDMFDIRQHIIDAMRRLCVSKQPAAPGDFSNEHVYAWRVFLAEVTAPVTPSPPKDVESAVPKTAVLTRVRAALMAARMSAGELQELQDQDAARADKAVKRFCDAVHDLDWQYAGAVLLQGVAEACAAGTDALRDVLPSEGSMNGLVEWHRALVAAILADPSTASKRLRIYADYIVDQVKGLPYTVDRLTKHVLPEEHEDVYTTRKGACKPYRLAALMPKSKPTTLTALVPKKTGP